MPRYKAGSAPKTVAWAARVSALMITLVLVFAVGTSAAAADTGGYPYASMPCEHSPYGVSGGANYCVDYDWGPKHTQAFNDPSEISPYGYAYRNCTDYVAWKLASLGVQPVQYKGLGNASSWGTLAAKHSVTNNATPAVGSVAVNTTAAGGLGHVAFVYAISGSQISVGEYNQDEDGNYSTATGTPAQLGFTSFDHFEQYETPGSGVVGSASVVPGDLASVEDPATGRNIFYVGTDGSINQWSVQGGAWVNVRLGGTVMPGTDLTAIDDPATGRNIFYVGTDGSINQWSVQGGAWVNVRLGGTVMQGTGLTAVEDPATGRNIFYAATDGSINQFSVVNDGWGNFRLGGPVMRGTGLTAVEDPATGRNIFYAATDGSINQFSVVNGGWGNFRLGGAVRP
jgi:surface antigen